MKANVWIVTLIFLAGTAALMAAPARTGGPRTESQSGLFRPGGNGQGKYLAQQKEDSSSSADNASALARSALERFRKSTNGGKNEGTDKEPGESSDPVAVPRPTTPLPVENPASAPTLVARPVPAAPASTDKTVAAPAPAPAPPATATPASAPGQVKVTTPAAAPAQPAQPASPPRTPNDFPEIPLAMRDPAVPMPVAPKSRIEKRKAENAQSTMEITSKFSKFDSNTRVVEFDGQVVVHHPTFVMESDELEVLLNPVDDQGNESSGGDPGFKKAIATGAMVIITRSNENGDPQIGKARKAEYDALTEEIILTGGPPTLQSGQSLVAPKGDGAMIILRQNGLYETRGGMMDPKETSDGKRSTVIIPIKAQNSSEPTLLPTSMEDIQNKDN